MSPRGPSRTPEYRKPTTPKTLKNHCFFQVFGGPRPSKTAYKDPEGSQEAMADNEPLGSRRFDIDNCFSIISANGDV